MEQLVERLEHALDGAGIGVWDWNARDNSVQFDRRWCSMLGLDPEETPMRLSTWESRVHPDDLARCYQDIQAHVEGRTEYYENVHRMRHESGDWIYILDRGRVFERDERGRPMRFTGTHIEITASERARQALVLRDRQLSDMMRQLPLPIAMLDRDLRFVAVSERWLREHHLESNEVVGRTHAELFPNGSQNWRSILRAGLGGKSQTAHEEFSNPTGEESAWWRWSITPWHELNGGIAGVIVTLENVSAEVQKRAADHEKKAAALASIATAVAHEINTPLQVALLEAEELEHTLGQRDSSPDEIDAVQAIHHATRRIADIVRALRVLSGEGEDPARPISVGAVLRQLEASCAKLLAQGEAQLSVELDAREARVLAREAELCQVLLSLLDNAVDAVQGQADRWVRLNVTLDEEHVVFRCADSGPGVDERNVSRLMMPFFSTKPTGKSGLGLSISQALVKRMGGFLEYDRTAEHTTFVLGVPRAPDGVMS